MDFKKKKKTKAQFRDESSIFFLWQFRGYNVSDVRFFLNWNLNNNNNNNVGIIIKILLSNLVQKTKSI